MKYVIKSLIDGFVDGDVDHIAQGCNCFNTQGAGVAKLLVDYDKRILAADRATRKGYKSKLGHFTCVDLFNGNYVFNLYTQYKYGIEVVSFDEEAFRSSLVGMAVFLQGLGQGGSKIGIPKIGSGLARGNWNNTIGIIKECLIDQGFDVTVFVLKEKDIPKEK